MLLGHQKQWEFLKRLAEKDRFPHAYLFTGQEKLGKRKIALEWISLLFGGEQHPDLILIEPEKKEIHISQIRNLIWKLSLKPYSAPFKAALIDRAHLMNQEAQTSILKTLEEPRGKVLLILVTEAPEYLFPTILSRVQTLKFYPVKKEEIKNYLIEQKISDREAEEISKISLGRPGIVIDFISDSKKLEDFYQKIKEINKISASDLALRFQYAKILAEDSQNIRETLDIWLSYFRNILLSRLRPRLRRGSGGQEGFDGQAKINGKDNFNQYSLAKLKKILKLIQSTNFLISTTNVNPKLALENLMLEL